MTNEEAIKHFEDMKKGIFLYNPNELFDMAIQALEQHPKTGKWIITGYDYKCSNCEAEINGEINYMSKNEIKYCPYCGMKLEV